MLSWGTAVTLSVGAESGAKWMKWSRSHTGSTGVPAVWRTALTAASRAGFHFFFFFGLFFMLCFYCVVERHNRKLTSAKTNHFSWARRKLERLEKPSCLTGLNKRFAGGLDTLGFLKHFYAIEWCCHWLVSVPNEVTIFRWKTVNKILSLLTVTQPVKLQKGKHVKELQRPC